MSSQSSNKGLVFIIISIIIFVPNFAGLMIAIFVLEQAPLILYIIPAIMIILSAFGVFYGITFRKK